jgi:pimeloyl-ACP methyl ester carboxylesterase
MLSRRHWMRDFIKTFALAAALGAAGTTSSQAEDSQKKPTIVLVHGAFAESSSWDGVIARLVADGYTAVAAANPLRGVATDAAAVRSVLGSISGPVVLVGHSYGGPVITEAANGSSNVKALVYVAAFSPDVGESSASLSAKYPGSTLADALVETELPDGGQDLYIRLDRFHDQFAADVPEDKARLMAVTQRPIKQAALAEPSGDASWKWLPSYAIYGTQDRNIPPEVMHFMATRAHAVKTVVIEGGSHALAVSHPKEVALLIENAASRK